MYQILPYSYQQAKKLGVAIKPSTHKGKKIDVYKQGKYICSIGALGYGDFPTFKKEKGNLHAEEKRRLYHLRHKKDDVPNTAGFYALRILW